MKISVNNKETEIDPKTTVDLLVSSLQLPGQGVAVAVNNKMIPRAAWQTVELQPGDNLVIIKAACGG